MKVEARVKPLPSYPGFMVRGVASLQHITKPPPPQKKIEKKNKEESVKERIDALLHLSFVVLFTTSERKMKHFGWFLNVIR
jgi:hypothetical protein